MLESGRSPKVSLRDLTTVSQLSYQCVKAVDGCTGLCRIREEPPYASAMVEWLARLPVEAEYRGERLPALSLSVFLALLKAKRRTPSAEEQTKLLEQHDHRCAMCGGIFGKGGPDLGSRGAAAPVKQAGAAALPAYLRQLLRGENGIGGQAGSHLEELL